VSYSPSFFLEVEIGLDVVEHKEALLLIELIEVEGAL
jgi:hypothetical protein